MISRYEVWLNGNALSEVSPYIYISDISYSPGVIARSANKISGQDGQYSGRGRGYTGAATISINVEVRSYSTTLRQSIVQDMTLWASSGGWLKASDRDGQKIYVKPTRFPAVASVRNWTDPVTIEFTAFDYPFWIGTESKTASIANGDTENVFFPGVYPACVSLSIACEDTVTELQVQVADTVLALDGLSLAQGDSVIVSYTDEHHILKVEDGNGVSLLNKRTAASSDELIAQPGYNEVSFTADGDAVCNVIAKGVYL